MKKILKKKTEKLAKNTSETLESVSQPTQLKTDSNASPEGAKFRVTFLVGQFFRGQYRQKGEIIELPENDARAYSKRKTLKIERIE